LKGVQQVFQGSLEREDTTTVLRVILINVADSKVLLSRRIVLRVPIQQLTDDDLRILAQDFNALTVEAESTVRWYYVAGAVLVAGVTIYLASRGVFDRKEREFEHEPPQPPPPPPGN
jgi:energy-converting hydrogenase Eha subunit G